MLAGDCTIFLGVAGALSAGGMRMVIAHLIEHRYVDCLVSTGANLYHDLHETRGRHHYLGSPSEDDGALQAESIDRVYDTYANEAEFIENDEWIAEFALTLDRRPYSSRELIHEMGRYLDEGAAKADSIVHEAYKHGVPIFCPAFSDCSAGLGIVAHYHQH